MNLLRKLSVVPCLLLLVYYSGTAAAQIAVPAVTGSGAGTGAGVGAPQLSADGDVAFGTPASGLPVDDLSPEAEEGSHLPGLNPLDEKGAQSGQEGVEARCGQSSLAAVLQPLCNFYQRMQRLVSSGTSTGQDFTVFISALHRSGQGIRFHRLAVMDLLVMDTESVELFVVDGNELKRLGVAPGMVEEMSEVGQLQQQLEKTLDTLPEGIGTLPDTMALAVWDNSEPPVGSLMDLSLAVKLKPSALVLLSKLP